jgi:hypothetical protein
MKTLLLALISIGKSKGTREGAVRGLMGIGKEAIRKGVIEGGGAKVIGSECQQGDRSSLVEAVMVSICPLSFITVADLVLFSGIVQRHLPSIV